MKLRVENRPDVRRWSRARSGNAIDEPAKWMIESRQDRPQEQLARHHADGISDVMFDTSASIRTNSSHEGWSMNQIGKTSSPSVFMFRTESNGSKG